MRHYVTVSGVFLALLTLGQLTRLFFRAPVVVAGIDIPLWASAMAALLAGTLAAWAFRLRGTGATPDPR